MRSVPKLDRRDLHVSFNVQLLVILLRITSVRECSDVFVVNEDL